MVVTASWKLSSIAAPPLATLHNMRLEHADLKQDRGWHLGPWNSDLNLSIGYASQGVDEPHLHTVLREVYLVAQGTSEIRVGSETVPLQAGDVLVVEPGEPHTFLSSSPDYLHFVVQAPGLQGAAAQAEKRLVSRYDLSL